MMRRIVTKLQMAADVAEDRPMPQSDEAIVIRFVDELPEPQREIFLRHRQGETFREIAASMNLGPKVVLTSIAKSYSHLRMFLMPDDADEARASG